MASPFRSPLPLDGKGTYVLILHLKISATIRVGRLGPHRFKDGYYAYVGSALGPGGLAGRIGRHAKAVKRCRWHIDYLRRRSRLSAVWHIVCGIRREHAWADILGRLPGVRGAVPGFGSSDCGCESHLFHFGDLPDVAAFRRTARHRWPNDPPVRDLSCSAGEA